MGLVGKRLLPIFFYHFIFNGTYNRQALQQAMAAYKPGRRQVAERLYRALLRAQPHHPDATYQVGVLGVSNDKPVEAIPLSNWRLKPTHR